jgi:hypothetical protein
MRKRGEGNRAANLSKPSLSMDCRIKSGNDDMKIRSRDACAPELCQRHSQNRPAEQDRVTPEPAVGPAFGSIMPNK